MEQLLPILRLARPEDAPAISSLYHEAYRPEGGGDPREHYPFPQFLDPGWVESIVRSDTIRWLVAELDHEIIGTCGGVVNIGSRADRVAECFGLVIGKKWHFRHFGTALFKGLHDSLTATQEALFLIAETRTSHPGGWKVVRNCNFIPLGFEPYAHSTPAGSESMLLTGKILPAALAKRKADGRTSDRVHRLSTPVLEELDCRPLPLQGHRSMYPLSSEMVLTRLRLLESISSLPAPDFHGAAHTINIEEDETACGVSGELKNLPPHMAGIISLQRLEGNDSKGTRYHRRHFLAFLDNRPVAFALAVRDRLDRRVRILDLRTIYDGIQGLMVQHILHSVLREAADRPLTVVVDVRADNASLHGSLESLGFFPSVYYPALIAEGEYRVDAVQFTRLYNLDREGAGNVDAFREWPSACNLVSWVCRK